MELEASEEMMPTSFDSVKNEGANVQSRRITDLEVRDGVNEISENIESNKLNSIEACGATNEESQGICADQANNIDMCTYTTYTEEANNFDAGMKNSESNNPNQNICKEEKNGTEQDICMTDAKNDNKYSVVNENLSVDNTKRTAEQTNDETDSATQSKGESLAATADSALDVDFRVNDSLKTIATYKCLALNKGAHSLLLKEDLLIGQLVLFLGDDSPKIVKAAFEVIKILYNNRSNHVVLKNSLHFLEALIVVSRMSTLPSKVREDALKIHDIVRSSKAPLSQTTNSQQRVNSVAPEEINEASQENNLSNISHRSGVSGHNLKVNRSRNNDRETIISIDSKILHQALRRQDITAALVKIKGIISVTYNMKRNHCTIRAKAHVPPEAFGKTIANLGVECYLVRRENKEEVLFKMEADHTLEISSLEQENVPSYLPDDEEDEDCSKNDMVARADEGAGTVTGKITNFLRKSFFW